MADSICITGIHAFGYHGVLESERANGQDFYVDVVIDLDLTRASVTDDVTDTINYALITNLVVKEVTTDPVNLIETLTARIAERVKTSFAEVELVTVTVHKPQAPVGVKVKDISVTISR